MSSDLAAERVDYRGDHLLESAAPTDPYPLFDRWLADAFGSEIGHAGQSPRAGNPGRLARPP